MLMVLCELLGMNKTWAKVNYLYTFIAYTCSPLKY
jgi:hypothetical protein